MNHLNTIALISLLAVSGAANAETLKPVHTPAAPPAPRFDAGVISGLGARNIGSATMSGRIAAIAARVVDGKTVVYIGAASGGVWKSLDGATTFEPVFDKQPVQSIGALAIDPNDVKTIWAGTGEAWTRNSVSAGDGIYKSTDGGDSWTHMGLKDSERIAKIIIDPKDSNTVYACVPGRLWSDSAERGLYKTTDGGKSWAHILKGTNLSTGCSSLSMDPQEPGHLIAALWDFRRKGWIFRSGGATPTAASGSGLFSSRDGGKTWSNLDTASAKGLPAKPWGRAAVAFAPSSPKIVYAFIESTRSALFRSDDGGATWSERDRSSMMVWRPFYFANLVVDPLNPDRLFKPDGGLIVSVDGGKSFSYTGGGGHGDWHDIWIDSSNTQHIIGGDDGGLWISHDGGNRWWKVNNLPVSQFYHVSVDNADPYHVFGGLQDNSSWIGDSAYPGGITNSRWENLYGGDGFWTFADPADANFVYAESQGGYIGRVDRRTLKARDIQPQANYREKLRFNWNTPIHLSPNEKGTIYIGAQFLFRSRDHGDSWERISPDLTTNDPMKQKQEESGGVTVDNSSAEMHTTIYSISESPKDGKVIWAGTDDGNLQLTRDGGAHWNNVVANITGLPAASWVAWVEASRHDAATAYAAFDRHTFGDFTTYVYHTADFGKSWSRIAGAYTRSDGKDQVRGWAHVIKEDSEKPGLLFLGTENGLWISLDAGARWAQFSGGEFPSVAVDDLVVQARESDLVIATHGRGIWIIDDLTPLRALTAEMLGQDVVFLPGRPVQQRIQSGGGWVEGDATFTGSNPQGGAAITYYRRTRHLIGGMSIEVLDESGKVVETLPAGKRRGINRVYWSMREKAPVVPPAAQTSGSATQGPRVVPGRYTVRLTENGKKYETTLDIGLDRRAPFTVADRKAQHDAVARVIALFGNMTALNARIVAVRDAAGGAAAGLDVKDALRKTLTDAAGKADTLRKEIVATTEGGAITGEERLREHADGLYSALNSWEGAPAGYLVDRTAALEKELADVEKSFAEFLKTELPKVNAALSARKLPPIAAQ
jgi:photosystem II stability/assembly factor-like uncharacterized protein